MPDARKSVRNMLDQIFIEDQATLAIDLGTMGKPLPADAFPQSKWDVVARAGIGVHQNQPKYEISASLWYTSRSSDEEYRWWEISYYAMIRGVDYQPFALDNLAEADIALTPGMHNYGVASTPVPIDDENVDDFCNRWAGILAKAYQGKLRHPNRLPLQGPLE